VNSSLIYLRIGEAAWWERLPDGSGVSREAPAPFCEGLVGKFHGSTLHETFNTLKNQGYEFEHNFGHGYQHLTTLFTHLMMLAFFIDQCLQYVNKRFQDAVKKWRTKGTVWELMRSFLFIYELPDFETLYHTLVHPPPVAIESIA